MKAGYRKLILGLVFMGCATFLAYSGIQEGSQLTGVASVIGALAAGVFGVVYGNLKEHQAKP